MRRGMRRGISRGIKRGFRGGVRRGLEIAKDLIWVLSGCFQHLLSFLAIQSHGFVTDDMLASLKSSCTHQSGAWFKDV